MFGQKYPDTVQGSILYGCRVASIYWPRLLARIVG